MGHLAGDAELRIAAERLRENIPRGAFAARWGGDEFVVVLPGLKRAEQQSKVVPSNCGRRSRSRCAWKSVW